MREEMRQVVANEVAALRDEVLLIYDDGCNDVDDGLEAYSHHDRFPPWWGFVRDDNDGNLSGDKIPPLTMIIINHLTQFKSSH